MSNRSRSLAGVALGLALVIAAPAATALAAPADAGHGEQLARRWCAPCHIVASDQTRGADGAASFSSVANRPGFSPEDVARFLMDPHPKMPDMQLGRDEARDLGAYIATLAK